MILGNGLLARAFTPDFGERDDVTIIASGVSNSRETSGEAFRRERSLLESALSDNKLAVYFSTCSIYDPTLPDSPYIRHKLAMEALVAARSARWAVFRLPQIVGRTSNPHTLTNYLSHRITRGEHFQVWAGATRNLIDVDHVAVIARRLLSGNASPNSVSNIASPFSISVLELVHIFERVLGKRGRYAQVAEGCSYPINVEHAMLAAVEEGISFGIDCMDYVTSLVRKYYEPGA